MRLIVVPTSELSGEILERLRSWSRSGLLEPFGWWAAETEDFAVDVVRNGDLHREPLSQAIGPTDPDDIRLVGFHAARRDGSFDPAFGELLAQRTQDATQVIRFRPGQPLRATMLLAPAAAGQRVPPGLFRAAWSANVLIAPEDRRAPESSNVLADTSEVLPAHAAHALATLADLWRSAEPNAEAILDKLAPRQGGPHPVLIVPVRCYSRFIDLGYLPDHLAAEVFQRARDAWPNPDSEHFQRIADPTELVVYITRRYLRKHAPVIGLTEFTPIVLPPRPTLSIMDALRWIRDELIRTLRRKPLEIAEGFMAWAVNEAANRVERWAGPERPFEVGRWRDRATQMTDLKELRDDLERPLVVPAGPIAETWNDFLRLHYGLVDGAPMPDGLDGEALQFDDKRLVVTAPEAIAPDPLRRPPADADGQQGRACDPLYVRWLAAANAAEAAATADGDDPAPAPPPPPGADWGRRYRDVPAWMIGESLADAIEEAASKGADPPPDPPGEPGDAERRAQEAAKEERRRHRRSRRRLVFALAVRFLAAGLASVGAWALLPVVLAAPVQFIVFAILVVSLVNLARHRWEARQSHAREQLAHELERLNAFLERALRKADHKRLIVRYEEYLYWAEIVGWLVHRPWVGEPLHRIDLQTPIDPDSLPAAMSVAVGRTGERVERLRRQGQKQLYRPRWLSGLYASVEQAVMDALREEESGATGVTAVARRRFVAEAGGGLDSNRHQLLEVVRGGRYRHLQDNELCRELLTFLDGLPVDFVTDGVLPADAEDAAEALPPATAWFSPPDDLPELAARLKPAVVEIAVTRESGEAVGGTGVLISEDGLIATARHVVESARELTVSFGAEREPAELVARAAATDVALLRAVPPAGLRAARLTAPGRELRQGIPVITLGYPLLQAGETTLAWGLITASDRTITIVDAPPGIKRFRVIQATYQSAGGASGSPVFDLDGQVIGIHSAGSADARENPRGQYMSYAVPADEVHALMGPDKLGDDSEPIVDEATAGRTSTAPSASRLEATAFLSELIDLPSDLSFLPDHWVDATDSRPLVARTEPMAPDLAGEGARLGGLAGPTAFLTPIRILLHRVELAAAVPPEELRCAADGANDGGGSTPAITESPPPSTLDPL